MYPTNFAQPFYSNKFFSAGIKFYQLIKLAVKTSAYKDQNSNEYLPYVQDAIIKGYTVLDVGSHKQGYLSELMRLAKLPGKLIVFETSGNIYGYLQKMKQLMKFQNIAIEHVPVSNTSPLAFHSNSQQKKADSKGAPVIDFNRVRIDFEENEALGLGTIDSYCSQNFIIPALIKFKLEGNDLTALQGADEVMQKYKPQILVECSEGAVTRETMVEAFKYLKDLQYSGYFILDTIKVPLANFDFNVYQNEVLGFYCNNFIFE